MAAPVLRDPNAADVQVSRDGIEGNLALPAADPDATTASGKLRSIRLDVLLNNVPDGSRVGGLTSEAIQTLVSSVEHDDPSDYASIGESDISPDYYFVVITPAAQVRLSLRDLEGWIERGAQLGGAANRNAIREEIDARVEGYARNAGAGSDGKLQPSTRLAEPSADFTGAGGANPIDPAEDSFPGFDRSSGEYRGATAGDIVHAGGGITGAERAKLTSVERGATADQTGAEIVARLEALQGNARLDAATLKNRALSQAEINGLITAAIADLLDQGEVDARINTLVDAWARVNATETIPNSALSTKLQEIIDGFDGGGYKTAGGVTVQSADRWTINNIDTAGYAPYRELLARYTNVWIGIEIPTADKPNLSDYRLVVGDDRATHYDYHTAYPSSGWEFLEDASGMSYYQQQVADIPLGDYYGVQKRDPFRIKPDRIGLAHVGLQILRHGELTGRNIPSTSNDYRTNFAAIPGLDLDDVTAGQIGWRVRYAIVNPSNAALGFDAEGDADYEDSGVAFVESVVARGVYDHAQAVVDGVELNTAQIVIGAATQAELKLYLVKNANNEVSPIVVQRGSAGNNSYSLQVPNLTIDLLRTYSA